MRVVVLGCGRLGSQVANMLDGEGHQVAIIDRDELAFAKLRRTFSGEKIVGFGFDHDVLASARLDRADAFVAATAGDNRNIVAALAAKRRFRVPKVVARIYDPNRAEIYLRQGILTVSPVQWSAGKIRGVLLYPAIEVEQEFGNGEVAQIRVEVPHSLVGRLVNEVSVPGDISVSTIVRAGKAILPTLGSRFEDGDVVRFVVAREAYRRLESFLGMRG
jgi:trk system potassium uptake protein TrkA